MADREWDWTMDAWRPRYGREPEYRKRDDAWQTYEQLRAAIQAVRARGPVALGGDCGICGEPVEQCFCLDPLGGREDRELRWASAKWPYAGVLPFDATLEGICVMCDEPWGECMCLLYAPISVRFVRSNNWEAIGPCYTGQGSPEKGTQWERG